MASIGTLKFNAALQNTEENKNSCEEKKITQSHEHLTLEIKRYFKFKVIFISS